MHDTRSEGFTTTAHKTSVRKAHTQLQGKHGTFDIQGKATNSEEHKHEGQDNQCPEATLLDTSEIPG